MITKLLHLSLLSIMVINHAQASAAAKTKSTILDKSTAVTEYINNTWDKLTRHNLHITSSKDDPKIPSSKLYIYIAKNEDLNKVKLEIFKGKTKEFSNKIEINYLPENLATITHHGLLYLPKPYVVPGGRFNEMYGWDSYFIMLGLLRNGRIELAKDMIENLIYQVNHYGTVLNANRTYDLERSHPPLLSEMILAYYDKTHDKAWLKTTLPALTKFYQFWMSPPHYIPELGLSRYYAGGKGPAPEEEASYYLTAIEYYKSNVITDYDKNLYFDPIKNTLKPLFYVADRTVRESGLDISAKFGPFGAAILDYVPVDLNSLLYQMEMDLSKISSILKDKANETEWKTRAQKRAKLINQYLWDDALGYYFDYNFKLRQLRPYVYATTFYPLWAGVSSKSQAKKVVANLSSLLAQGGIVTSTYSTKSQWDAPFGWAPLQFFAVKGLENYGFHMEAKEVATRFLDTINNGFNQSHEIFEKYDVQHATTETASKISYGYSTNETGFGWTNGVYLELNSYVAEKRI